MKNRPENLSDSAGATFWIQKGNVMEAVITLPVLVADLYIARLRSAPVVHGNSQPVRVLAVDEAEALKWREPRGTAKPVEVDQVFLSAQEASEHMGYPLYNEVGMKLSAERRRIKKEIEDKKGKEAADAFRVRPKATVRGVLFQYEEDVKE